MSRRNAPSLTPLLLSCITVYRKLLPWRSVFCFCRTNIQLEFCFVDRLKPTCAGYLAPPCGRFGPTFHLNCSTLRTTMKNDIAFKLIPTCCEISLSKRQTLHWVIPYILLHRFTLLRYRYLKIRFVVSNVTVIVK